MLLKLNQSYVVKFSLVTALTVILSGCARDISSNSYNARKVGEAAFTYQGIVVSTREVEVNEGDYLENNGVGILAGGAAGGLAGNQIGSGSGNIAATVGGAVIGAVAGALAEKALKEQKGIEYVVRLNNGQMMTVVQGTDSALQVNQRVFVIVKQDGRSRVVVDNSSIQDVQPMVNQPTLRTNISHSNIH